VKEFLEKEGGLKEVVFVLFSRHDVEVYEKAVEEVFE